MIDLHLRGKVIKYGKDAKVIEPMLNKLAKQATSNLK